jgi:hypothetical protein
MNASAAATAMDRNFPAMKQYADTECSYDITNWKGV